MWNLLTKNEKAKIVIVNLFLTIFLLLFFTDICPIVPYDKDDWIYLGQMRMPIPMWNGWNPTKILPEVLMPMCGYFGARLVYPIVGDYLLSITIAAAMILSAFIVALCVCVMRFMVKRMNLSVSLALIFEVVFLVFCFLIFRNRGTSRYMFYADNMNCIFNYTVSGIINAISVLTMMQYRDFQKAYNSYTTFQKGRFITLIYFSVFSNIFHSEMLAIYCGVTLLHGIIKCKKDNGICLKEFIQCHSVYLVILITWIGTVIFEISGGRAARISSEAELSFITSLRQLATLAQAMSKPFITIAIVSVSWMIYRIIKKDIQTEMYLLMVFNLLLVVIYLVVLCSGVNYMSRIEASWNIWFYAILITLISIANFVSKYSCIKPFLILLAFLWAMLAAYPDGRFLLSTVKNVDYYTCVRTGEYITDQIIDAECTGQEFVVVYVPHVDDESIEWIFGDDFGRVVMTTLYNHGIIHKQIEVETVNDPEFMKRMRLENKK